jgi:hypothetical protein
MMDAAASCTQRRRAAQLLLAHCAALDPVDRRPTARTRLETALGQDMARRLVLALSTRR